MKKNLAVLWALFAGAVFISQSLMDLFSVVLCLYLIYFYFRQKKTNHAFALLPRLGFEWLWISWVLVIVMGFWLNPRDFNFMFLRVIDFKWILILYALITLWQLIEVEIQSLDWILTLTLILSLYAVLDYAALLYATRDLTLRLGGIFDFSMTYAHSYGLLLCFLFGLFLKIYPILSRPKKIIYTLTLFVLGLSVFLTYTRGVWIAVFFSVIITGFVFRPKLGLKILAGLVTLGALMYVSVPPFKDRVDFSFNPAKTYDQERIALWRGNIEISKDHPFFGVGYGANKFVLPTYYKKLGYPDDQYVGHAHNQYLHFLGGTGYIGALIYILILGVILARTHRAYRGFSDRSWWGGLALGSLAAQLCFIFGGLTESNFEHAKVRFAIMLFWALGLGLHLQIFSSRSKTLTKDSPSGF